MKVGAGEAPWASARCHWVAWAGAWMVAASLAGCGGGGSGPTYGGSGSGATVYTGTGTVRVKVSDQFGEAVPGASVFVGTRTGSASKDTDANGEARFDEVQAGLNSVCVRHPVRGSDGCASFTVQEGKVLELSRQLKVEQMPTVAVLQATVDPGGVSADGRSLDLTVTVAVSGGKEGSSWFSPDYGFAHATSCEARTGAELAELGPRCIAGVDGSDASYTLGAVNDAGVVRSIEGEWQSGAVGLLIDQSEAGLASTGTPNEPRLFAAKVFADSLLPNVPLAVAAFASDTASGSASMLPQRPVTFFPIEAPGFVSSRTEAFQALDALSGLVGGGAPLYAAMIAGIEFMADQAPPGSRPVLVVLADGTDSDCGTPAECAQWRRAVVERAQQAGVRLFLVGDDSDGYCGSRQPWDDEDRYYCELAIAAEPPLWELSSLGGMPLVVGSVQSYWGGNLHSPLGLVRRWLSGSMAVQDIRLRLTSAVPGAFSPGAAVTGILAGINEAFCPWDCMYVALPFRLQIPDPS